MNWEAIAATAELLGAGGVIASLLYLAGQVRTSSRIARQDAARMPGVVEWWALRRHWFSRRFRDEVAAMQRTTGPSASLLEPTE